MRSLGAVLGLENKNGRPRTHADGRGGILETRTHTWGRVCAHAGKYRGRTMRIFLIMRLSP